MEYFRLLRNLLAMERREDEELHRQQMGKSSVNDRRAQGSSWYPVAIRDTEMGRGDYLTVELERTTHRDLPHQLRFGAPAAIFSNHNPGEDRVEGVISWQSGDRLKLTLRTDELPHWSRDGKLGIDLLFDDNSYDEMEAALKQADARIENQDRDNLLKVLTGVQEPTVDTAVFTYPFPDLNASQEMAVHRILSARELSIVHGPPGTGKTTTLVEAIRALYKQDHQRILVVAPSNTAVDLLSEKLSAAGLNVLRVGNPVRVSERLNSLTLDSRMQQHPSMKEIGKLKKRANEFRNMAHKYKRSFGKAERDQRNALFNEARDIMKQVLSTEQYILDDLVARAQVVAATLVGANHYTVRNLEYHTVVIDEAGQSLEPACWIPILKAKKLVLAGDHLQLPPTIKSAEAARNGLSRTLLEKLAGRYPGAVTLLNEQYRMNETIMGFSSAQFYEDRLSAHPSVATRLLFEGDDPLLFIDTAGCGFDEKAEGSSTSNPEEAAFVIRHVSGLLEELEGRSGMHAPVSIAVISPYKQQVLLLRELAAHSQIIRRHEEHVSVNTIDSFQGQERDVVYISMTRSNTESKIGFLADTRRMNVAMTRARKKLVVTGDSGTLSASPFYAAFIAWSERANGYRSAWEWME
ncbi:MAG: IGHMBP2 family helicase [Chitinophagaceae bacterium]|nr:MAG: IGHMBP2 family helicase [Chitinophagaceae bacterium]